MPTGEQVTGDLASKVLLLHLQLELADGGRSCHEIPAISELLASWRALVESSGAFVREPVPSTFQIIFGLFQPGDSLGYSSQVVRLALELGDLIADYSDRMNEPVHFRASVILATTGLPASPHAQPHIVGVKDANLAAAIASRAPQGNVIMDAKVAEAATGLNQPSRPYSHPGETGLGPYRAVSS